MPLHPALSPFFNVTVSITPFVSYDSFNKPTYGTAVNYSAKVENSRMMLRTDFGMEEKSTRLIYLNTQVTTITTRDKLTLPAALAPVNPKILSVRTVYDVQGVNHIVLITE